MYTVHDIISIDMNPDLPFGSEHKKTFWQKLLALPLKLKIVIIATVLIIFSTGVVMLVWRASIKPLTTATNATESQQSGDVTGPEQAPQTEEEKKEAEKKEEEKAAEKPSQSPNGTPPASTPPASTPPSTPPPAGGSTRPSSSNTGTNGTLTATYSGGASNGSSNVTYENMNFPAPDSPGYYIFSGNNLTFRNCHINGGGILIQGDNITIEHCTIEGGVSFSGTNGVTFQYNDVKNFSGDGIHLTSDSGQAANITISHNYIHSPTPDCGDHADGIQIRGVNTLSLVNNNFDMGPWFQVCGQDALNAAIFFESANGGNSNLTVDGNYLNGAGITLRLNPGSNQKIINNRFGRNYQYGIVSNNAGGGDITQNSGNVMDDNNNPVNF